MRRHLAPLFIFIALLAASCGSGTEAELETGSGLPAPDGVQNDDTPSTGVVGIDAGIERYLAAAVDQSAEIDTMRFSLEMAMGGLAELGGDEIVIVVSGAVSEDGSRGEMVMDMSDVMRAAATFDPGAGGAEFAALFDEPIEIRYDGSRVYMSSSFLAWLVPVDTPWITFEDDGSGAAGEGMGIETDQIDPDELLVLLRGLGDDAEVVGTEDIDGVSTTHIRGRFSAANLADAAVELGGVEDMLSGLDPTGTAALDLAVFDLGVWIGDDGIVRRLQFGVDDLAAVDPTADPGSYVQVTMELTDIGEPIEIVVPPADQVTDIEDLMGGAFFG